MTEQVSRTPKPTSTPGSAWVSFEGLRWASQQMSRGDLAAGPKLVLFAMAAHVRDDSWTVWPSQERIAADTGMTRRGVQGAIDALVDAGLVSVEHRQDDRQRDLPNVYRLTVAPGRTDCAPVRNPRPNQGEPIAHEVQDPVLDRTSNARAHQPKLEDTTPPVLLYPVDGGSGTWTLRQALVDEFAQDFPKLDVVAECRQALAWVKADACRRKTATGMRRFLTGWLTRSTERTTSPSVANGKSAPTAAQAVQRRIDASGTPSLAGLVDWGPDDAQGGRS